MITLALVLLCQDPQVREQEPNDAPESVQQEIAPGGTWVGTLASGDHDWVHLACAQPTTCSLVLEIADAETARLEIAFAKKTLATHPGDRPIRALRVRFPAGRTALHLSGEARQYALRITPVAEVNGREVEPNDVADDAIELREGEPVTGQHSGFNSEEDHYRFEAKAAGPRRLVLRLGTKEEQLVRGWLYVTTTAPNGRSYAYDINALDAEFHFYPVLEPGTWHFVLSMYNHTRIGAEYELRLDAFQPAITAAETASATAAIERATRFLLQLPESRQPDEVVVAAEAMALAALAEGLGAAQRRDVLERDFVGWLAERLVKVEGGQWRGSDVHSFTRNIYTHTMATLGLAEAAANGSERARDLARRGAEFLIATQNTEHKPKHWNGPIARESRGYGGWRYSPGEPHADLSIHGWAVIALTAVDAAGIRVEGMRESVVAALDYVRRTGDHDGFGYEGPGGGSNVHNSIGALLLLLYGESSAAMNVAARQLDTHQWAATQVDRGDGYAFYYLYYATRAQYLRGGAAWSTWRAATLRQLLRRQQVDGSWAPFRFETQPGPRWTTALGLMALRLCLDQAPRYLRVEAKGF